MPRETYGPYFPVMNPKGDDKLAKDYAKRKRKVSKDELRQIFKQHDSNGDGSLSKDEVEKAFSYLRSRCPSFRSFRGRQKADKNKDGLIDCNGELDTLVDYAYSCQYDVPDGYVVDE